MNRILSVAMIVVIGLSGCQGAATPTESGPSGTPTPAAEPSTSASPEPADPAIVLSEPNTNGGVTITIDPAQLEPLSYTFNEQNASDPFWHLHTEQSDLFVGIEFHTVYGPGRTGPLGTFTVNCGASGICVYVDPDGTGPAAALGPAATGIINITQLDDSGYNVTLTFVAFPKFYLADLTLVG